MTIESVLTQCVSQCGMETFSLHLHLHLVILQTLSSKVTYNWGIHKAINLEEANRQRKCPQHQVSGIVQISKYKLAREGEKDKEKDEDIEKGKVFLFFMMKSSSVERYEFSVVA